MKLKTTFVNYFLNGCQRHWHWPSALTFWLFFESTCQFFRRDT